MHVPERVRTSTNYGAHKPSVCRSRGAQYCKPMDSRSCIDSAKRNVSTMYAHACMCTHSYTCTRTYTVTVRTRTRTHTYVHRSVYTHTFTRAHRTRTYARTPDHRTHTCTHTLSHLRSTLTRPRPHTLACTYANTPMWCMFARRHTHPHTWLLAHTPAHEFRIHPHAAVYMI